MPEYSAFVRTDRLPPTPEILRALSSRGWAIELEGEAALPERAGDLGLKIDGQPVPVQLRVDTEDLGLGEGEAWKAVAKGSDVRLRFSSDHEGGRWARDVARGVALLAMGAFLTDGADTPLQYGR
jgi:hypothetical protein